MHASPLAVLLLALFLTPAARSDAEIYRWRDAQGREHFTTQLGQVPAAYRNRVEKTEGGNVNRASSSSAAASSASGTSSRSEEMGDDGGSGPPPARAGDGEEQYLGKGEDQWRSEVSSLRSRIEVLEQGAARCADSEGVRLSAASDARAYREEAAEAEQCERTRQDLELQRNLLTSLQERARQAGVPPGWLR